MELSVCHSELSAMQISNLVQSLHECIGNEKPVNKTRQLLAGVSSTDRKLIAAATVVKQVYFNPTENAAWTQDMEVFPDKLVFQGSSSADAKACYDALLLAVHKRNTEYVNFLIDDCSADVQQEGSLPGLLMLSEGTDLFSLVPRPTKLAAFYIKRYPEKITPLWLAAKQGLLSVVSQLASHGADVNYIASDGSTALHNAVLDYNMNVVRLLVSLGANARVQDNDGRTAIELARQQNMTKVAEYLEQPSVASEAGALFTAGTRMLTHSSKLQMPSNSSLVKLTAYWQAGLNLLHESGITIGNPLLSGDACHVNVNFRQAALGEFAETTIESLPAVLTVENTCCLAVRFYEHCCGVTCNEVVIVLKYLATHLSKSEGNYVHLLHVMRYALSLCAFACGWAACYLEQIVDTLHVWHPGASRRLLTPELLIAHLDDVGDVLVFMASDIPQNEELQQPVRPVARTVWPGGLLPAQVVPLHVSHISFLNIVNTLDYELSIASGNGLRQRWQAIVSRFAPYTLCDGRSLLIAGMDSKTNITSWMLSINIVEALVRGGVDLGVVNSDGDTALHLCAKKIKSAYFPRSFACEALDVMLGALFHVDIRNNNGETVKDILMSQPAVAARYATHPAFNVCLSLQCLAASAVRRDRVPYEGKVPKLLLPFLQLH